jgi:hypothetical protein
MADDWKTLGRPPTFSGHEDDWTEWSFVFRSYASVLAPEAQALVDAAEENGQAVLSMEMIDQRLGAGGLAASRKIFYALVMSAKGPALAVVRSAPMHNGAEARRLLYARFEPNTALACIR